MMGRDILMTSVTPAMNWYRTGPRKVQSVHGIPLADTVLGDASPARGHHGPQAVTWLAGHTSDVDQPGCGGSQRDQLRRREVVDGDLPADTRVIGTGVQIVGRQGQTVVDDLVPIWRSPPSRTPAARMQTGSPATGRSQPSPSALRRPPIWNGFPSRSGPPSSPLTWVRVAVEEDPDGQSRVWELRSWVRCAR